MQKFKTIFFFVLSNTIIIAIMLYGFEFLFDPYDNMPKNGITEEGRHYTWGHLIKNNSYCFRVGHRTYCLRERPFGKKISPETYRIIVLGDSLTWGAGLAVEERYTAITEKLLNKHPDKRRFEVLNFGISGGPTIAERHILHIAHAAGIDANLIVVGFCLNDPQPRSQTYSPERKKLKQSIVGRTVNKISIFLKTIKLSYVSQLFTDALYTSAEKIGIIPTWQEAIQRTYEPSSREWQLFVNSLKDIKRISDEMGCPAPIFMVLNQGTYKDRPTDYQNPDQHLKQYLKWYHQAEDTAKSVGFLTFNHEKEIVEQLNNETLSVNPLDGHPSANLNRIYGEKLYKTINNHVPEIQTETKEH